MLLVPVVFRLYINALTTIQNMLTYSSALALHRNKRSERDLAAGLLGYRFDRLRTLARPRVGTLLRWIA